MVVLIVVAIVIPTLIGMFLYYVWGLMLELVRDFRNRGKDPNRARHRETDPTAPEKEHHNAVL